MRLSMLSDIWSHDINDVMFSVLPCIDVLKCEGRWVVWKIVLKGNLLGMMSNWPILIVLGQPKQQVDVTQADDGDIQSEFIDGQLSKGSHLMMGISKETSLRTHHQWGHQYIHASGATLDNRWTYHPSIFCHGFLKTEARILGFSNVGVRNTELVSELISELILELLVEFTDDQTEMIKRQS